MAKPWPHELLRHKPAIQVLHTIQNLSQSDRRCIWIKITSTNPQFFEKVKSLFGSLKSFKDIGPSAGLDENIDLVYGIKQTSVDKDEIIKIFNTLVIQNKKEH